MVNYPKRVEHGERIVDYNKIDDNIYIGTNQCCQVHFDDNLLMLGITSDISLEENRVDTPFGVESYLWLPTKDHTPPSADQLQLGARYIKNLVEEGKMLYVHCKNGHGRAPTLVSAYYILTGKTADEAIAFVESKREGAHIEDVQKEALREFERSQ